MLTNHTARPPSSPKIRDSSSTQPKSTLQINTPEERRAYKARLPRTKLADKHLALCKMLPDRRALLDHMPKRAIAAEVGVAAGDFTAEILARTEPARLHLVDSWQSARYEPDLDIVCRRFKAELDLDQLRIERGQSVETLSRFPEAFFDWVYIDTDHSFDTTFAELSTCNGKVNTNGHIAGHDFCVGNVITPVPYGVIEAVLAFCVDFKWRFEFLTCESSGHLSFSLVRL